MAITSSVAVFLSLLPPTPSGQSPSEPRHGHGERLPRYYTISHNNFYGREMINYRSRLASIVRVVSCSVAQNEADQTMMHSSDHPFSSGLSAEGER